jgi:hypothetical protein
MAFAPISAARLLSFEALSRRGIGYGRAGAFGRSSRSALLQKGASMKKFAFIPPWLLYLSALETLYRQATTGNLLGGIFAFGALAILFLIYLLWLSRFLYRAIDSAA